MYMLVFCGGLSALVQIERPSSIYVGILFRLSMLVRLVQPCVLYMLAMYVCQPNNASISRSYNRVIEYKLKS